MQQWHIKDCGKPKESFNKIDSEIRKYRHCVALTYINRQRQRQKQKQTDRQRQTDRQTDRDRDRDRERQSNAKKKV